MEYPIEWRQRADHWLGMLTHSEVYETMPNHGDVWVSYNMNLLQWPEPKRVSMCHCNLWEFSEKASAAIWAKDFEKILEELWGCDFAIHCLAANPYNPYRGGIDPIHSGQAAYWNKPLFVCNIFPLFLNSNINEQKGCAVRMPPRKAFGISKSRLVSSSGNSPPLL